MVVEDEALPQVTVIGQVPGVVLAPTVQLQLTFPPASEVAGARPWAVDGPDLYLTTMEHEVLADVRA